MTYEYTKDLSTATYVIMIDPVANYGYWEEKATGAGGQLWFIPAAPYTGELVDGRYGLPDAVAEALQLAEYFIESWVPPPAPEPEERRRV